ncbi:MAG TPA: thioredoxin-dependent thiol peroxidase [Acidobacteriota bacterium]|nr:thioredoxin-dependent thiol peroxidase [Acidobacteriota bacterium]
MLKVGSKAPQFTLESDEGKKIALKDFLGKKVVLYFYPKDDTPGCTKEACSFTENNAALKKAGAVVLGVSADSVESHGKFKRKYDLSFPLLSDPKREVIGKYGVWQEKNMYGKKMMGIVRTTYIIDSEGKVAAIFPKVKVDGHTEKVLEKLKEV